MRRAVWTGVAASGGVMLALSSVGLLPMIEEELALRSVRSRFQAERLEAGNAGEGRVSFRCGGRSIVLGDDSSSAAPQETPSRRVVTIEVGDTALRTAVPVALRREATGANRYWGRVVPFRWTDRDAGRRECGIAYRLPSDTAAVRREGETRARSYLGFMLESVRGERSAFMHGTRFRVIRWDGSGGPPREQDFAYADWAGDPYGTLVLNLLGASVGLKNQSIYYWPTLLFPLTYPIGLAVLGVLSLGLGLIGRHRARAEQAVPGVPPSP